jgi:hypothetical protein
MENTVNRELFPKVPQRPKQSGTRHPKNPFGLPLLDTEDPEDIREAGRVPRAAEQFPNCTPQKIS